MSKNEPVSMDTLIKVCCALACGKEDVMEILIVRKAKRISSNVRSTFSTYEGRKKKRDWYVEYLKKYPYAEDIFKRYIGHIVSQMTNEELVEERVLDVGYF